MSLIQTSDLEPFAAIPAGKAQALINDAEALAARVAPCLTTATDAAVRAAAKAILRRAILRWNDIGSGALQSQTAGPFGVTLDTRQAGREGFWPSEEAALAALCADSAPTPVARNGWLA